MVPNKIDFDSCLDESPELLLSIYEREQLSHYNSFHIPPRFAQLFGFVWSGAERLCPESLPPCVISLCAILAEIYALVLLSTTHVNHPTVAFVALIFLVVGNFFLELAPRHAKAIRNDSAVSAVFGTAADAIAVGIVGMCFPRLVNDFAAIYDVMLPFSDVPRAQWLVTHAALLAHAAWNTLAVFRDSVVRVTWCSSVFELIFTIALCTFCGSFGVTAKDYAAAAMPTGSALSALFVLDALEIFAACSAVVSIVTILFVTLTKYQLASVYGVLIFFTARTAQFALWYLEMSESDGKSGASWSVSQKHGTRILAADAGVVVVFVVEIFLCRVLPSRTLSPAVPMASIMVACLQAAGLAEVSITVSALYLAALMRELCISLRMPLFTVVRNVYVNGVYDLLHLGHMNLFLNALQFGNRLVVGVHSDEDCSGYKRPPYMTLDERASTIARCRGVSRVVRGAPLLTTHEFLLANRIHRVAISPEYDSPTDHWYADAREQGIIRILPRTKGLSTSELIGRIESRFEKKAASQTNVPATPFKTPSK